MNSQLKKKQRFLYQIGVYGFVGGAVFWGGIFILWSLLGVLGASHQLVANYI